METSSPWKLIKTGFWFGIGFIGPLLALYVAGTILVYVIAWLARVNETPESEIGTEAVEKMLAHPDDVSKVRITNFREVRNGNRLLILGTIRNSGATAVGAIQIEAELLDSAKQLVFECAAEVSKKLKPRESENFQITCDYGQPLPKYKSVELKVLSGLGY